MPWYDEPEYQPETRNETDYQEQYGDEDNPQHHIPEEVEVSNRGWFGEDYNARWGNYEARTYQYDPITGAPTHHGYTDREVNRGWSHTKHPEAVRRTKAGYGKFSRRYTQIRHPVRTGRKMAVKKAERASKWWRGLI